MKFAKKISAVLLILGLCISCCSMVAYAADGSITFTDPETAVGEMVDITCVVRSAGEAFGDVEIGLSYDSASLRFDSGEGVTAAGDGALTYKGSGGSQEESFTMTFQALAEGSTKVTLSSVSVTTGYGAELALEEGDSTVTIAEGDPSKITQQPGAAAPSAGDMQVEVNGVAYTLTDSFGDMVIPEGYTRTSVTLEGQDRQMVVNASGTIYLGYLIDASNVGDFFVYNEKNATFFPYEELAISDTTSIIVLSDISGVNLPETYQQTKLTLNEKEFPVWQDMENDRYYVIYAMNTNGDTGYYRYDSDEGTYQRVEIAAAKKDDKADEENLGKIQEIINGHLKAVLIALGVLGFAVLVLIIVLAVKLRNRNLELDDLYDEYGIDLEDEEPKKPAVKDKKPKSGGLMKAGRHKYEDDFLEDDFDEDDFDEDDFDEDDFDEDDFDEDDFDEDDFEEEEPRKNTRVKRRPGGEDFSKDDFEEEEEDDDIFSDKNIKKYDTKAVRRGMRISDLDDTDGLGELMEDLAMERPGHQEEDDAFKVDIVDLD